MDTSQATQKRVQIETTSNGLLFAFSGQGHTRRSLNSLSTAPKIVIRNGLVWPLVWLPQMIMAYQLVRIFPPVPLEFGFSWEGRGQNGKRQVLISNPPTTPLNHMYKIWHLEVMWSGQNHDKTKRLSEKPLKISKGFLQKSKHESGNGLPHRYIHERYLRYLRYITQRTPQVQTGSKTLFWFC